MYINEVTAKTKITIETIAGEKMITFDTTSAKIVNGADQSLLNGIKKAKPGMKYIVLDPVRRNDKLVNFAGGNVVNHMVALVDGNRPFIWKNISIINMKLPVYGSVHVVLSAREGAAYNRRKSDRAEVNCEGTLRIRTTEHETVHTVTIKNLSESGIAFITGEKHGFEKGSGCLLDFQDGGYSFHFDAVVLRIERDGSGYTMACRNRQRSGPIASYVSQRLKGEKKEEEPEE